MDKVLITRVIPANGIEILKDSFDVIVNKEDRNLTKNEIAELSKDVFGIVSMVSDKIDKEVIESAKNLRIIANYGVGINNVDINSATEKGVLFTNTPDVLTQATAELGFSLILACARHIPQADRFTRSGKFSGFSPVLFLGKELYGATLGIIGMGRIGATVARMAHFGFNMNVIYYNRTKSDREKLVGAKKVELEYLLKESDVVVVCAPLNEDSKYMLSKNEFSLMKDDAIFVNIGRGEIVDTNSLIEKAQSSKNFVVGLDVYENEPNFDKRLLELDNCVMLPHIGSATHKTRMRMAEIACMNVLKVKRGECPDFVVNGGELCLAKN